MLVTVLSMENLRGHQIPTKFTPASQLGELRSILYRAVTPNLRRQEDGSAPKSVTTWLLTLPYKLPKALSSMCSRIGLRARFTTTNSGLWRSWPCRACPPETFWLTGSRRANAGLVGHQLGVVVDLVHERGVRPPRDVEIHSIDR